MIGKLLCWLGAHRWQMQCCISNTWPHVRLVNAHDKDGLQSCTRPGCKVARLVPGWGSNNKEHK